MEFDIGIACGRCDTFSPIDVAACPVCGHKLLQQPREKAYKSTDSPATYDEPSGQTAFAQDSAFTTLSEEELMEHARNYICRECSMPVPSGHKFCGTCGAAVPPEIVEIQTKFFGNLQEPGRARLILIRGDSEVDGLSYVLQGNEHVAGREAGQILFPEDTWLSPRHANFVYEGGKLVVRDEGSANGVYLRVREPVSLEFGDQFLCGEHLFRMESPPEDSSTPDADQTHFYCSPRRASPFVIAEILCGGVPGSVFSARGNVMLFGREDCDVSYPKDIYMSGNHAKVEMAADGSFKLSDANSKNGTYIRIKQAQPLQDGDYLFLGRQLLRVEITA